MEPSGLWALAAANLIPATELSSGVLDDTKTGVMVRGEAEAVLVDEDVAHLDHRLTGWGLPSIIFAGAGGTSAPTSTGAYLFRISNTRRPAFW